MWVTRLVTLLCAVPNQSLPLLANTHLKPLEAEADWSFEPSTKVCSLVAVRALLNYPPVQLLRLVHPRLVQLKAGSDLIIDNCLL